ncbi:hypothetical protein QRX50_36540 [Amycolatopsis carbonis]|uniref:Restriction endonuclease domain-containing protein n=1 Tax=Amycolatopsis carbonis TaxID=715471 RepID=A0A9Y2ICA4_9PSEU|nr:hypothetical protein [Amycolatopsis sp. 2-15]WIX76894.1 hypothetical protein QRX50_36540 [Amycolatopsis sp. 2-15]
MAAGLATPARPRHRPTQRRSPDRRRPARLAPPPARPDQPGGDAGSGYDTKTITRILTGLVLDWADAQPRKFRHKRWIGYRELTIPITPGGAIRYGRLDVVVTRPGPPDLVIEIDSTNNPRSVEKLQFAHAAGAVPVWIRWGSGARHEPPGVTTIDLRPSGVGPR